MGIALPDSNDAVLGASQREGAIVHWRRTLGRHIWFLRRAGIPSAQIEQEVIRRIRECIRPQKLRVSASDERLCARIMAQWRHDSVYLDARGVPLALRFAGRSPTFSSLVRAAVPQADASLALTAMRSVRVVSRNTQGNIRLIADGQPSRSVPRGAMLEATHAALEALTHTCYANLHAPRHAIGPPRLHQVTYTEYLNPRSLRAYEEFLRESAQVFLAMHESWLKRHEPKTPHRERKPLSRVGVGIYVIRGR